MLYCDNAQKINKYISKSVAASFVFHKSARRPSQTAVYVNVLLRPSKVDFIVGQHCIYRDFRHYDLL